MNKKETDLKEVDIVSIPDKQRIIVHEPKLKVNNVALIVLYLS